MAKYVRELQREIWRESRTDPFRDDLLNAGERLPELAAEWSEPVLGEPAFDPELMVRKAAELNLGPDARFEHPTLEKAVRIGLAHIDATFQGNHPKYGVRQYAHERGDGFPPTIEAAVDALTLWGMTPRAQELFTYWLNTFVKNDGLINYYGTSLSEYGKLLTSARKLVERGADPQWLAQNQHLLNRLAEFLLSRMHDNDKLLSTDGKTFMETPVRLMYGVPEADMIESKGTYFHNNAWAVRGLRDWAHLLRERLGKSDMAKIIQDQADELHGVLLRAWEDIWPSDPEEWWLRPTVEYQLKPTRGLSGSCLGGYTNYRYWPELMASGVLPRKWMERLLKARLTGGGQFCGASRVWAILVYIHRMHNNMPTDIIDNWPLMDWLEGLMLMGEYKELRLCLWGHIYYHQAQGHMTAYESVSFPPGREHTNYCLPCQLVVARAAKYLVR